MASTMASTACISHVSALLRSDVQPLSTLLIAHKANNATCGCAVAVDDFSKAIAMESRYADCWKRRGQARSALGENEAALQVLSVLMLNAQNGSAKTMH